MHSPGADVVAAFGMSGEPGLLRGGQGRTFAVGQTVLRRDAADSGAWTANLMSSLPEDGFRVARPQPRLDGQGWVFDGWTAWERVSGEHRTWGADWQAALGVAVRFHRVLRTASRPDFLDRRQDVFAVADRMAWGEVPLLTGGRLGRALEQLAVHRRAVSPSRQVVHGDIAGNLLWDEGVPPAVIDMSPYWRPSGMGAAQLVADATLWYGADIALAETFLEHEPVHGRQFILRALMFRLAIDAQLDNDTSCDVRWERSQVDWDLQHAGPLAAWAAGKNLW